MDLVHLLLLLAVSLLYGGVSIDWQGQNSPVGLLRRVTRLVVHNVGNASLHHRA